MVVKDGHFAGIVECSDCGVYKKEMSHEKSAVVALIENWDGYKIACGKYNNCGVSPLGDDFKESITHYLVKKN